MRLRWVWLLVVTMFAPPARGADGGADPEVNKTFTDPALKVDEWVSKFEIESREVYKFRKRLVATAHLKRGMAVADVGAGTGLFTFLFAAEVGKQGLVYAVDIAKPFLAHIASVAKSRGLPQVKPIEGGFDSPRLPEHSVDRIFICDTYHHFEHPSLMLTALARALRPGGELVLVDFKRDEAKSSAWTLKHVRAGEAEVIKEFAQAGFVVSRRENFLTDNYVLVFKPRAN